VSYGEPKKLAMILLSRSITYSPLKMSVTQTRKVAKTCFVNHEGDYEHEGKATESANIMFILSLCSSQSIFLMQTRTLRLRAFA
jgi:hypothetical protein